MEKCNCYHEDYGKSECWGTKERDAFLNAASGSSTKPQKQKKDAFLEGFDDPYGEKREQERQKKGTGAKREACENSCQRRYPHLVFAE